MKGKKNLERAIVLGLLLSTSVYGTAWAEITHTIDDAGKLIITANETVKTDKIFNNKYLNEFENVEIHFTANEKGSRPLGVYSARYDLENTNITVFVDGNSENNDSLHLTNHYPHFYVNDYTVYVNARSSDALNLSRDITTSSDVIIGGNLTAEVAEGHGIRANASIKGKNTAEIVVRGNTNITIEADSAESLISSGLRGIPFYTSAIWAGTETYYDSNVADGTNTKIFNFINVYNKKSEGKGVIDL